MKRRLLMCLLAMMLLLSACSSNRGGRADLIGTWTLEYSIIDGEKEYAPGAGYSFYEDGTGKLFSSEGEYALKWILDGDTLRLSLEIDSGSWTSPLTMKISKLTSTELQLEVDSVWPEGDKHSCLVFSR